MLTKIIERLKELFGGDLNDGDMIEVLDNMNEDKNLAWKTSVVDFLVLIGVDSSRANRDALAVELGVEPYVSGSAEGNENLRKALFKALARNGGQVPSSLTD